MTAPIKFVPNPAVGVELRADPLLLAVMKTKAEAAANAAKAVAPVGATGDYAASIGVGEAEYGGFPVATVEATDFKARWIEFGTGQPGPTPAFAPLRRGAEGAGLIVTGGRG